MLSADIVTASTTFDRDPSGTDLQVGHTVLMGTEQMFVSSASGTRFTVIRAVNGSTGASHGSGDTIEVYEYPAPIREAALMEAGRLWRLRDSGYAANLGNPEGETVSVNMGFDLPTRLLLNPYRKIPV